MPEMRFIVRWPDDTRMSCYSPSLVVRDYLEVGATYSVADFVQRIRSALHIASERVREKYGFPCVRAAGALAQIESKARAFEPAGERTVRVESFDAELT